MPLTQRATVALLCILLPAQTPPALTAREVVGKIRHTRYTTSFQASGRLVRVDSTGRRTAYPISLRARAAAGVLSLLYEVNGPGNARIRIAIDAPSSRQPTIRIARAAGAAMKDLPFARWGEPILDSDLSFEDLTDDQLRWDLQTLNPPAQYGARRCLVLKSESGSSARSHYASVTSWLDQNILFPVKVEKRIESTGVVKEFLYYGLRQSKGVWSASQIEVRTKGRPGSTFLIISRGSATAEANSSARYNAPHRQKNMALEGNIRIR